MQPVSGSFILEASVLVLQLNIEIKACRYPYPRYYQPAACPHPWFVWFGLCSFSNYVDHKAFTTGTLPYQVNLQEAEQWDGENSVPCLLMP